MEELFDKYFYGISLRSNRYRRGYRRAEDFCKAVTDLGLPINKECLYRIEKGEQPPTVYQCAAFKKVLGTTIYKGELL